MAVKGVTIKIDTADLKTLKDAGYRLCFAKKVSDTYNVVWQSYDKYLPNNDFEWEPRYELFGSNVFEEKVTVSVSTNPVEIRLGERATLDESGILGPPSTGPSEQSILMINEYGNIHPGLSQLSIGDDGSRISTPIYVAEKEVVKGEIELTPVEMVQVWFEQDIETSTMFSDARSMSVEIDLTFSDNETRLYKDGGWSKPPAKDLARFEPLPTQALVIRPGTAAIGA